jgi:hypothetical protein
LTEQNDPGYLARLQLGTDAIQRSAAARGGVVTGGTAKDLATYGQDYASNEYGNVYNRALNSFDTNFNAYNTNQTNQFNKLAALSGVGQQTATQLAGQGQNASNNVTSNAGAATASGYVGGANAYGSALNGIGSNISNLGLLSQMGSMGGGNPYMNLANSQHLATQSSYVPTLNNNLTTMIGS